MACNCKRKIVSDENYFEEGNETLLEKAYRFMWKLIIFPFIMALACIIIPIFIFIFGYRLVFKKDMNIVLPKFLGKYMK